MTTRHDGWALITGAGSPAGIGFAIAAALGAQGRRIAITSTTDRIHDRVRELQRLDIEATGWVADLMEPDAAGKLVAAIGAVDVLVNNAGMAALGVLDAAGPLEDMTLETWRRSLDRNLTSAFLMTRAALAGMKSRRWGRIVHVASTTGPIAGIANDAAYAAAKAGMVGMMRSLCLEVAAYGVTVNSIAPGWIATGSQTESESRAGMATPTGRSGLPAEVAAAIAFLCSPAASYVNGHLLVVDGGNSVLENRNRD
jgi:3-oxoacyl-[acyl-carrier protein] reductase